MPRRHYNQHSRSGDPSDESAGRGMQSGHNNDAWSNYQPSPAASSSFYDDGTWSWQQPAGFQPQAQPQEQQQQPETETWVLWCDDRRVLRAMIKIGECNSATGQTRIRRRHDPLESAFVVDMSTLLPFDWSLVDNPAPFFFMPQPSSYAQPARDDDSDIWSNHSGSSLASVPGRGSHQTSVMTRQPPWKSPTSLVGQPVHEKKYRGGAAPAAPSYDGSRDPAVIKRWKKEVKVWLKLSAPYLPAAEQGLRLWQALKGQAQEKFLERDDEDLYFADDGVQALIAAIDQVFGQDEMIDLGDRLDAFFDPNRIARKDSESVKDYIDRFELTYGKLAAIGESLSIRSQAQRMMKGMRLDKRDTREMLQLAGGWNYNELVKHLRIYSQYFKDAAAPPTLSQRTLSSRGSLSSRTPSTGSFRSNRSGSSAASSNGSTRSGGSRFTRRSGHGVNAADADDCDDALDAVDELTEPSEEEEPLDEEEAEQEVLDDVDPPEIGALPIELAQELYEAGEAFDAAHSVNSVTDGVKKRLNNAKQAAGAMRRGPQSSRDKKTSQTIQEIKNRTLCGACGKSGHWHDDPECEKYDETMRQKALQNNNPRAGAGGFQKKTAKATKGGGKGDKGDKTRNSKSVNFTDHQDAVAPPAPPLASGHWVGAVSSGTVGHDLPSARAGVGFFEWQPKSHGCMMLSHVQSGHTHVHCTAVDLAESGESDVNSENSGESMYDNRLQEMSVPSSIISRPHTVSVDQLHSIYMTYAPTDLGLLVLDTACARSVAGIRHLQAYELEVEKRYSQSCWQVPECETFTFGNCASQVSHEAWKVPGCIASSPIVFSTSSLEGSFPILLSLQQQGSLGIRIDTEYHTADIRRLGLVDLPLRRTSAGHLAIDILEHWPSLGLFDAIDDADLTDVDKAVVVHTQRSADTSGSKVMGDLSDQLVNPYSGFGDDSGDGFAVAAGCGSAGPMGCEPRTEAAPLALVAAHPDEVLHHGGLLRQDCDSSRSQLDDEPAVSGHVREMLVPDDDHVDDQDREPVEARRCFHGANQSCSAGGDSVIDGSGGLPPPEPRGLREPARQVPVVSDVPTPLESSGGVWPRGMDRARVQTRSGLARMLSTACACVCAASSICGASLPCLWLGDQVADRRVAGIADGS